MPTPMLLSSPPPRIGWSTSCLRLALRGALRLYRAVDRVLGGRDAHVTEDEGEPDATIGPILDRGDAVPLFRLVHEHFDRRMGGLVPSEVRLGFLPACGVLDLRTSNNKVRQILIVGLPCFQIWSVDELSAVIAHEMAHLKLEDAVFTREVVRVAGRLRAAVGSRRVTARVFGEWLARRAAAVCREMEFRADRWSAQCVHPDPLRTALEKLMVAQPVFRQVLDSFNPMENADDTVYGLFSRTWDRMSRAQFESLRGRFLHNVDPNPLDPHPTVAQRLDRLARFRSTNGSGRRESASALRLLNHPDELKQMLHNRVYRARKAAAGANSVFFPASDEDSDV